MIESVERLQKFVDEVDKEGCSYVCTANKMINLPDLKEALSLIPPYAPGEEIEVSDDSNAWEKRFFVGFSKRGKVVAENEMGSTKSWEHYRPIPETVDLKGFPVDALNMAEKMLAEYENKELPFHAKNVAVLKAIVTSARKE